MQKNGDSKLYPKLNSKYTKDICKNVTENIKFLEEMDFIKMENFCVLMDNIQEGAESTE